MDQRYEWLAQKQNENDHLEEVEEAENKTSEADTPRGAKKYEYMAANTRRGY